MPRCYQISCCSTAPRSNGAVNKYFVCTLALAGCGKKDDTPKAEGDPKPAPPGPTPKQPEPKQPQPNTPEPKKPTPPTPPESLKDAKADIVLTAEELDRMGAQANELFVKNKGKVIELTGTVARVAQVVQLSAGPDRNSVGIPTTDPKPWKKAFPGQTIRLRTRAADGCIWEIIDVKGPLPPELTAEEFSKERSTEKVEFDKKYKSKFLIVTGTIAKVETVSLGSDEVTRVWLQGVEKSQVLCLFSNAAGQVPLSQQQKDALKMGQRVKVLGQYTLEQLMSTILLEPAP